MSDYSEFIVVGAGITGLLCAQHLQMQGHETMILEKGSQVGGRLATLNWDHGLADYGAQFFTTRDLRFQMQIDQWLEDGFCKRWFVSKSSGNAMGAQGHVRYCASQGMAKLASHIAGSLNIQTDTSVDSVTYANGKWELTTHAGTSMTCTHLILTAPLPESLKLLEKGNAQLEMSLHDELKGVRYQKSLALVAKLGGPSGIPDPGAKQLNAFPLAWIADNQTKGLSKKEPLITIHSTADFASENWTRPIEDWTETLLQSASKHLAAKIIGWKAFKWKYAFPSNPWHDLFIEDPDRNLYLAGDAFGGPRVEGAALSALQCAYQIVGRQQNPEALA